MTEQEIKEKVDEHLVTFARYYHDCMILDNQSKLVEVKDKHASQIHAMYAPYLEQASRLRAVPIDKKETEKDHLYVDQTGIPPMGRIESVFPNMIPAKMPEKVMVKYKVNPELTTIAQKEVAETALMAYRQALSDIQSLNNGLFTVGEK
jgi:hypothetical protein